MLGGLLFLGTVSSPVKLKGKGDQRLDGIAHFPWSNLQTLLAPNHDVYNSTEEIHSKLDQLMTTCSELTNDPNAAALRSSAISDTRVLRLTSTTTPSAGLNKTNVLLTFGIHGREYVASEVGLAMIYKLCDGSARSAKVLATTDFLIFPVFNAAGRRKMGAEIQTGEYHSCSSMRKNGRRRHRVPHPHPHTHPPHPCGFSARPCLLHSLTATSPRCRYGFQATMLT